jgi:Nif-specific regulatory protein
MASIEPERTTTAARPSRLLSLREQLEAVEKEALEGALQTAGGNRAKAARLLSTTERIFNYRVRKYGIDWRRFRNATDDP